MKVERLYLKEYFPELGVDGCNAFVDCYIPARVTEKEMGDKKYPCLVICPGGGYERISDRETDPIVIKFISEGYRIFVVNYSVAPRCFPQQLREVAGAMELVHKYAEEWDGDASRIAIMGFSAGGHLAAQYSNRYDCPEIREIFPDSKPVQVCVLNYAVLTANLECTHRKTVTNFVGHTPTDLTEKGCSCELLVSERTPPTFLWHTVEDKIVPVESSMFYASALRQHGVPFELHIYPYGPHGLSTVDEVVWKEVDEKALRTRRWIDDVKSWLKLMGF